MQNSSRDASKNFGRERIAIRCEEKIKMQAILEQNKIAESFVNQSDETFGNKIGLFGQLFGCWHKQLSRPFTKRNVSYRACLHCGARRGYNTQTLKTFGPYHYPPIVSSNES